MNENRGLGHGRAATAVEPLEARRHLALHGLALLPGQLLDLVPAGGDVYYRLYESTKPFPELYRLDANGASRLVQPSADKRWSLYGSEPNVVADERAAFLLAPVPEGGHQIWHLDRRTDRGTPLVGSPDRLAEGSTAVVRDGVAYFVVEQPRAGGGGGSDYALWRSDGTPRGTHAFRPAPPVSWASTLAVAGPYLYFGAATDAGTYLFRSDGTEAGTIKIRRGAGGFAAATSGNSLYFAAAEQSGIRIFVTDGTLNGTRAIGTPADVSDVRDLTPAGSRVFFSAQTAEHGREVWVADARGTRRLTDLNPGPAGSVERESGAHTPSLGAAGEGRLAFTGRDGAGDVGLWTIDARDRVRLLAPDARHVFAWSDRVYYVANRLLHLSKDGTAGASLGVYTEGAPVFAPAQAKLFLAAQGQIFTDDPKRAAVVGRVFLDNNNNGRRDPVDLQSRAGMRVYADLNGDGRWRRGEPWTRSYVDGGYQLGGIAPGAHVIRVAEADGWVQTTPAPRAVTLRRDGTARRDIPVHARGFAYRGRVFVDDDGDGRAGPGEAGAAGFRVFVDYDRDGRFDAGEHAVRTSATGAFALEDVRGGYPVVAVVAAAGWRFTTATEYGSVAQPFEVRAPSFGVTQRALLRGLVRRPARNAPGYAGWRVFADRDGDGAFDAADGELATITGADGRWALTLPPGTHRIFVELRGGYESLGDDGLLVTVAAGAELNVRDFRVRSTAP